MIPPRRICLASSKATRAPMLWRKSATGCSSEWARVSASSRTSGPTRRWAGSRSRVSRPGSWTAQTSVVGESSSGQSRNSEAVRLAGLKVLAVERARVDAVYVVTAISHEDRRL